ncbi:MAG: hypothetical protein QJR06_00240 [Alicyclobacillaceae bacterium]|nr:hypothetical protein [Alicyclobacillaceae bacterium]
MNAWGLIGLAFLLGLRHGVDWDHIAAIGDFVAGESRRRRGFGLAMAYALGHELVILSLGLLAVAGGRVLSGVLDAVMERVVGATLLVLGLWLAYLLLRRRTAPFPASRWVLLARLIRGGYERALLRRTRESERPGSPSQAAARRLGWPAAVGVGVLHGIGAETPSQLMLFAATAGLGSTPLGALAVTAFAAGMGLTHLLLAGVVTLGYARWIQSRRVSLALMTATSAYSVIMGCIYLGGLAGRLPAL